MLLAGFAEVELYPVGTCTAGYILGRYASLADGMNWNVASFVCSFMLSCTPTGQFCEVCKVSSKSGDVLS